MTRDYDDVKDSGERQEFPTGAMRDTQHGKGRYDLVLSLSHTLYRLARHFENGAVKYGDDNWRKGLPLRRFLDSAFRHVGKFAAGEDDEDHLIAAIWNLCCLCETQHEIEAGRLPAELDDMPHYDTPKLGDTRINPEAGETETYMRYVSSGRRMCFDGPRTERPFCASCGASIPPIVGEGTCPKCDPPESVIPTFYVAGPMRGHDQLNFPMFDRAAKLARAQGLGVISPAEMDRANGIDPATMPPEDIDLSGIIQRDCKTILTLNPARGDGMILLPGWEKSVGARAEVALGVWMGLQFINFYPASCDDFPDEFESIGQLATELKLFCQEKLAWV